MSSEPSTLAAASVRNSHSCDLFLSGFREGQTRNNLFKGPKQYIRHFKKGKGVQQPSKVLLVTPPTLEMLETTDGGSTLISQPKSSIVSKSEVGREGDD